MSKRKPMAKKVIPLQGVLHMLDGSKVLHPPRFERVPPPPEWLDQRAKALWRCVAKEMHERAILTVLDVSGVAVYCALRARLTSPAAKRAAAKDDAAFVEAKAQWAELVEWAACLLLDPPNRPRWMEAGKRPQGKPHTNPDHERPRLPTLNPKRID